MGFKRDGLDWVGLIKYVVSWKTLLNMVSHAS